MSNSGLVIYYCAKCGKRLPPEDAQAARARGETHSDALCAECAAASGRKRPSGGVETTAMPPIPRRTTARVPVAAHASRSSAMPAIKKSSPAAWIGIGAAALVLVVLAIFALRGKRTETASAPANAGAPPAKTATAPPKAVNTPPPSPPPPPTAREAEEIAQKEFDALFEGIPVGDAKGRIARLTAFLQKHSGSIVASRARRMLSEQQALARLAESPSAYLSDLSETEVSVGHGTFGKKGIWDGNKITANGKHSPNGIGMHPPSNGASHAAYQIGGHFKTFRGTAAVNDSSPRAQTGMIFKVIGDGKALWTSRALIDKGSTHECEVSIAGVKKLELCVECPGGNGWGHAVWLEPQVLK